MLFVPPILVNPLEDGIRKDLSCYDDELNGGSSTCEDLGEMEITLIDLGLSFLIDQ